MRIVEAVRDEKGNTVCQTNWLWLPMFLSVNTALLEKLDAHLRSKFPPPITDDEETMGQINLEASRFICSSFPGILGMDRLLDELGRVTFDGA